MRRIALGVYPYDKKLGSVHFIRDAAERYCGRYGLTPPEAVSYEEKGKPYFDGRPELRFSLSHSGMYIVTAMSDAGIGVDLQLHKKCGEAAIAKRFFHGDEINFLRKHPSRFFDIWSAKESFVKYTGTGINASFRDFSVVSPDGTFKSSVNGVFLRFPEFKRGYSLAVASEIGGDPELSEYE